MMPANGGLLISDPTHGPLLAITVSDALGQPVAGTVVQIDTYQVWRPALPLAPGDYVAYVPTPQQGVLSTSFSVTAARPVVRPAITSQLDFKYVHMEAARACCSQLPGGSLGNCFPTQLSSYVTLNVSLTSMVQGWDLTQFLFKANVSGSTTVATYAPFVASLPPLWSQMRFADYCVTLTAIDIGSGRVFRYDDLVERCASGAAVDDLGTTPVAVTARELDRAICQDPPMAYRMQWCDVNASACEADRTRSGCEKYGSICPNEPLPLPTTPPVVTKPAAAGTSATTPAFAGSAAPSTTASSASRPLAGAPAMQNPAAAELAGNGASATPSARHVRACSVRHADGGGAPGGWGSLALLLALAWWRARTRALVFARPAQRGGRVTRRPPST
jgi:hypothetical protein